MSTSEKCPNCGSEIRMDILAPVFQCGSYDDPQLRRCVVTDLCRERKARKKVEADRQNMWDELHAITDCLGAGLPDLDPDSGKISERVFALEKRARDLTETARIIVEYIQDPERRSFYRKQIEVAGTDAFQKGGAR